MSAPDPVEPEPEPEESQEPAGTADVPVEEPPEPRRYPSTIGGAFYIAILITATVAIGVVTAHDWRLGVKMLGSALGAAGVLRLLLPERDAGMLAVRPRAMDVVLLLAVAVTLWWLADSIPNQPT